MAGLKFGNMTEAINSLDNMGWGRTGAAAGAAIGGTYGIFSDDTSLLGGAFKGAIAGFGGGRLARFGSQFSGTRTADQLSVFENSGVQALGEKTGNLMGLGNSHTKFRPTAVGDY